MSDQESDEAASPARCTFCQESYLIVGALIESPDWLDGRRAYICKNCVEVCVSLFEAEKLRKENLERSGTTES